VSCAGITRPQQKWNINMPDFSIIILSHNKPKYVRQAIQSVLDQTHRDWEALVMDSGILLNQGFFSYLNDPRITIESTGETPEFAKSRNMASWCFNRWLNSGKVRGELIMYLCDDDLLNPAAFETFWQYYTANNKEPDAMYGSLELALVNAAGENEVIDRRIADKPAGRFCRGRKLDCRVDYLQFCHTVRVLKRFQEAHKTTSYHSEDKRDAYHADGIFMEQIGALTKVHNIERVVGMNRRTAESANIEYSASPLGRLLITLKSKIRGGWQRLSSPRKY
jgi:spore maturation protein CgeD